MGKKRDVARVFWEENSGDKGPGVGIKRLPPPVLRKDTKFDMLGKVRL